MQRGASPPPVGLGEATLFPLALCSPTSLRWPCVRQYLALGLILSWQAGWPTPTSSMSLTVLQLMLVLGKG